MMQMSVDEIVNMVGVRHGLMPAPGPVHVAALMRAA
jgi:hypothetical protein